MQLMLHVSSPAATRLVTRIAQACGRAGIEWGCFFTHAGVRLLQEQAVLAALASAQRAVVCEHSWAQQFGDLVCPVELGSQTANSIMMAGAERVVSL